MVQVVLMASTGALAVRTVRVCGLHARNGALAPRRAWRLCKSNILVLT